MILLEESLRRLAGSKTLTALGKPEPIITADTTTHGVRPGMGLALQLLDGTVLLSQCCYSTRD